MMTTRAAREAREAEAAGPSTLRLVGRLIKDHLARQWGLIALAVLCMLAVAASTSAIAWLMKPAVNDVFARHDRDVLMLIALAFPVAFILKGLANYGQRTLMNRVGLRVVQRCREALYDHLQGMDIAFFAQQQTAALVSRFTVDLTLLKNTITSGIMVVGRDAVTMVSLVVSLFVLDMQLALIAVTVFPAAVLPIALLGKRVRKAARGMQAQSGQLDALLLQVFQAIRVVKVYNAGEHERARVAATVDRIYRHLMRSERIGAAISMVVEILSGFAFAAVVIYGGQRVTAGDLDPGTFFAFITSLFLLYQPIKRIGGVNVVAQEGMAAVERMYGVIDTPPALREAKDAPALVLERGEIVFDDVRLTYPTQEGPALDGLSFRAPAGATVALVGRSGAGKSTALQLVPRFYDADGGRVLIDGQDVRAVTFRSLWAAIAMVTQEIILFDDSVRANIAYGRPGASQAEIEDAARHAAAHDFILSLPEGYDTVIGEQGTRLSGGQRQRLVIARAMLKNAPILLLDEATSALDTESERHVRQAFERLRQGRTCIVVAHRLSTVMNADVIHVVDAGRIVESGSHAALLAQGGLYANLCATDLSDEPVEDPEAVPA
ncbi:ABC transporter ATP-binding protein [Rhodospirillum rubrum]|uniref:ABC transporter ATP-binding protein n=1 Tax=Rhodospirillum rubrum TaxID=1085 RepID=UPI0019041373|nr:ABC transporter ATP-binding protein [Rhodospirillum rubrum]